MRFDELVTQLKLPKFHIVGTDMKVGLALKDAMAHPDKIRRVIMGGAPWRERRVVSPYYFSTAMDIEYEQAGGLQAAVGMVDCGHGDNGASLGPPLRCRV
jgi:pimeloyl-ACP methyl ester carboxylesterase